MKNTHRCKQTRRRLLIRLSMLAVLAIASVLSQQQAAQMQVINPGAQPQSEPLSIDRGSFLQPADLTNYPNVTVTVGANAIVVPDAVPTGVRSLNASTDTNFKGGFASNSETGDIRVTNAHPAGTYTVRLKAFLNGGATTTGTFTLTVVSGTPCNGTFQFTAAPD